MLVKVTNMRPELQSQNRVDVCYGKTVGLGAWLTKALWKSYISLCLSQKEKSLAPKLTEWRSFELQNIGRASEIYAGYQEFKSVKQG